MFLHTTFKTIVFLFRVTFFLCTLIQRTYFQHNFSTVINSRSLTHLHTYTQGINLSLISSLNNNKDKYKTIEETIKTIVFPVIKIATTFIALEPLTFKVLNAIMY